jgi:hypothetical protein
VPTRRFPWVILALGLLVLAVVGAFYLLNRPRTVNITVEPTPSANPVAQSQTAQAGPPPTFTPPPAVIQPTVTPPPTPTRVPIAVSPSGFVPGPSVGTAPTAPPPAAAAAPATTPAPGGGPALPATAPPPAAAPPAAPPPGAAPPAGAPGPGGAPAPTEPGSSTAVAGAVTQPTPAPAPPTPFAGQVAAAGGVGNTRQDIDSAYGGATGQTPDQLVAYRKGNIEYHVGFAPGSDPARAWLIEELVPQGTQMTLEQAMPEARKLFPRDAQPRGGQPEGNPQFVVERFTSPTLGQAIPAQEFQQRRGNPGDFLAVYARDPAQAGRITRIIVGIGDDPNVLLAAR